MDKSTRERLKQQASAGAPPAAVAAPPKPKAEPKPSVRYRCGHQAPVAQIESGNCTACANKHRAERNRRKREKQEARRDGKQQDAGRLPHGSMYIANYDGTRQEWAGSLFIGPLPPRVLAKVLELINEVQGLDCPPVPNYAEAASGVFKLLAKLDAMYRAAGAGGTP